MNNINMKLVKVNGKRMIDTVVNGLLANGIKEIYVVVGHLKDVKNYILLEINLN